MIVIVDPKKRIAVEVSEYKGKKNINIRQQYVNVDGEWAFTKNGFTLPTDKNIVTCLRDALIETIKGL